MTPQLSPVATSKIAANGRTNGTTASGPLPAGVDGPEDPVAFEAVRPGPSSPAPPPAKSPSEELPDLASIGWVIPPIRWGGNTTSNYSWYGAPGSSSTFSETQAINLRASSYIYQPWYVQVAGDLGLLTGTSKSSGADSGAGSRTRSTSITYGGNVNVFPRSRFPFQAYLQTGDSRASASQQSQHNTTLRMGARQNYRPEVGQENYSASADRSIIKTSEIRSVVDTMTGTYGTVLADHVLGATANYSRNLGDISGQGSKLFSLNATHSWRTDEEFQIVSSANYTSNKITMLNSDSLALNNSQTLQANSSVTWVPDEDLPLTVSGGGNFLHLTTATETAGANFTSLSGYANANYRYSKNLSGTAGLTLSRNLSGGTSTIAAGQNVGVSYSGNPLNFGDYSYGWGTGAGLSNLIITSGPASRSLNAQAQHSLSRALPLSERSVISLSATQSYSLTNTTSSGQSGVLTHAGGASWQLKIGELTLANLTANATDSVSSGNFANHSRQFTSQGNLQTQLSARSALSGSLNVVYSQQLASPQITQTVTVPGTFTPQVTDNRSNTLSGAAQLSYSHRSPFDIPNLFYTATIQANASQTNLRLISGDPNALPWQTGSVFLQNVDYRLGRLTFRGSSSFAILNGKENASVFFTIGRELGEY